MILANGNIQHVPVLSIVESQVEVILVGHARKLFIYLFAVWNIHMLDIIGHVLYTFATYSILVLKSISVILIVLELITIIYSDFIDFDEGVFEGFMLVVHQIQPSLFFVALGLAF